ncbi:MAG: NUDIX domain-containing protein [Ruminococcus sp.]|nr:NUDIX domain-containing protein [Ruminococcus sp.]
MGGYIFDMRKLVGHRTIIQCSGSIIIVDKNGRLLLGKRTDNHLWGYAGGSVEIDEKIEDCAARELFEEMGIVADEMELFYINSGKDTHYIYPNDDEVSNIEIVYICRKYHGTPKAQESEIEELRYFTLDEITTDMISPPIRPVFEEYMRQFKKD